MKNVVLILAFIMDYVTIYLLHKYYRLARICDARYEMKRSKSSYYIFLSLVEIYRKFYPVSFRLISFHFDRFRFVSFDFVSFRFDRFFVSFDFVSFLSVSFRFYFVSHFTCTLCSEGYFGMDCTLRCYCKYGYCNSTSGVCQENKCKKGWTGEFCNEGNVLYS